MEIRAFSMNGKTKVYGAYSSAKKVKITNKVPENQIKTIWRYSY